MRTVAGETILVPIGRGFADLECVFTTNDVGKAIWQALDQDESPDLIADRLVSEFEVAEEDARRDVAEFLSDLAAAGLIRSSESEP